MLQLTLRATSQKPHSESKRNPLGHDLCTSQSKNRLQLDGSARVSVMQVPFAKNQSAATNFYAFTTV
uniref:Uncharacterized protein n=1 Tax=Romanomermis culicivorax TaxID=13658 RepID=A0A915JM10_ROMCU